MLTPDSFAKKVMEILWYPLMFARRYTNPESRLRWYADKRRYNVRLLNGNMHHGLTRIIQLLVFWERFTRYRSTKRHSKSEGAVACIGGHRTLLDVDAIYCVLLVGSVILVMIVEISIAPSAVVDRVASIP